MENNQNLNPIARPIFKVGCASIGKIMTESREKSAKQKVADLDIEIECIIFKIADLYLKVAEKEDVISKMSEKAVASKVKAVEQIAKIKVQIEVLAEKNTLLKAKRVELLDVIESGLDICLSQTCKTYLHNWVIRKKYGKSKNFNSEQTSKGNEVEQESIDFLNFYALEDYKKNEELFESEYVRGVPDIIEGIDIKSSYNYNTYFEAKINELNLDYFYQGHGYLSLPEFQHLEKWEITYCCVNTPLWIVEREIRKAEYAKGYYSPLFESEKAEIRNAHNFDDIPISKRTHTFIIERDNNVIEKIHKRVEDCRVYVNRIWDLC